MREFPEDVRRFVHGHINSVEQLEALLLLRSEPRVWSAEDVSRRLFSSPPSAATRLADLHSRGLVLEEAAGGASLYRYQSRNSTEDHTIAALDALYRTRKDAVIALIFSRRDPVRNIGPSPLQSFSDAFRLRPDDQQDDSNEGRRD